MLREWVEGENPGYPRALGSFLPQFPEQHILLPSEHTQKLLTSAVQGCLLKGPEAGIQEAKDPEIPAHDSQ